MLLAARVIFLAILIVTAASIVDMPLVMAQNYDHTEDVMEANLQGQDPRVYVGKRFRVEFGQHRRNPP